MIRIERVVSSPTPLTPFSFGHISAAFERSSFLQTSVLHCYFVLALRISSRYHATLESLCSSIPGHRLYICISSRSWSMCTRFGREQPHVMCDKSSESGRRSLGLYMLKNIYFMLSCFWTYAHIYSVGALAPRSSSPISFLFSQQPQLTTIHST